jgi:hypothetical protein
MTSNEEPISTWSYATSRLCAKAATAPSVTPRRFSPPTCIGNRPDYRNERECSYARLPSCEPLSFAAFSLEDNHQADSERERKLGPGIPSCPLLQAFMSEIKSRSSAIALIAQSEDRIIVRAEEYGQPKIDANGQILN